MRLTIEYACVSELGLVRSVNQDNYFCLDMYAPRACERTDGVLNGRAEASAGALFCVFDGMGGEQSGEDASYIAAATAAELAKSCRVDMLRRICEEANRRIVTFTVEHGLEACGSTAAMLYLQGSRAWVCSLGDSRVYQVHPQGLEQLSEDHVMAVPGRRKPALVRYLGAEESGAPQEPYLSSLPLKRGDRFLICSDGLTDMVAEQAIAGIIAQHQAPAEAVQALKEAALAAGGRDNMTIIFVQVVSLQRQMNDFFPFSLFSPRDGAGTPK